ncbi:MAG TPA: MmcQ/YjbR family DNA-binding protein [Chloroflexota bacterium]|nr:MmcQ/YjbR family DNA-binding protein [Chloroflexota bacterium]
MADHSMHPLEVYGPGDALLAKLREVCLVFPEAVEAGGVGAPSFTVKGKIFAMQHRHEGRPSLWCKAPPGAQELLVGAAPERFFRPPYVGHHGWVGIWIDRDDVDWPHAADLVEESYRMSAPKRLVKQLDGRVG